MASKKQKYSLETANEIYSYWGRYSFSYKLGVGFFGLGGYLRRKAVNALNLKKGDIVIDLACGPGIMFSAIERKIGATGKIIGVDYVNEMIEQSRKLAKCTKWDNIVLINQDAANVKLKKNSVDAVISTSGLSAIPDHCRAIKNCYDALKKGGVMAVLDDKEPPQKYSFIKPLMKLLRWSKSYEKKDIIKALKAQFSDIQAEEFFFGTTFIATAKK